MPSYQTYQDVLSENTGRRNVYGSSIVTLLVLALWQSGRFRGEPRPASDDEEGKPTKD